MISLPELCQKAAREAVTLSGDQGAPGQAPTLRICIGPNAARATEVWKVYLDQPVEDVEQLERTIRNEFDALGERRAWVELRPAGGSTCIARTRLEGVSDDDGGTEAEDANRHVVGHLTVALVRMVESTMAVAGKALERNEQLHEVRAESWSALAGMDAAAKAEPRALELQASLARTQAARDMATKLFDIVGSGMAAGMGAGGDPLSVQALERMGDELAKRARAGQLTPEQLQALFGAVEKFQKGAEEAAAGGASDQAAK